MIEITSKCTGCSRCVPVCPFGAIHVADKKAVVGEACTLCGACVQVCALEAIEISRPEASADLSAWKGLWVFVETAPMLKPGKGGHLELTDAKTLKPVTHELLSAGRKLADELGLTQPTVSHHLRIMVDEGILDGDYVVVKPRSTIEDGQIGVVLLDDEATVKRVLIQKDRIALKPANRRAGDKTRDIKQFDKDVRILGKVVGCIRTRIK